MYTENKILEFGGDNISDDNTRDFKFQLWAKMSRRFDQHYNDKLTYIYQYLPVLFICFFGGLRFSHNSQRTRLLTRTYTVLFITKNECIKMIVYNIGVGSHNVNIPINANQHIDIDEILSVHYSMQKPFTISYFQNKCVHAHNILEDIQGFVYYINLKKILIQYFIHKHNL